MRRWRVGAGVVLLAAGVLLLWTASVLNVSRSTTPIGGPGEQPVLSFTPSTLTAASAKVQWTGGSSTTQVYLTRAFNSASGTNYCSPPAIVASGDGATGSFAAGLSPSSEYLVIGCNGTNLQSLTVTLSLSGGVSSTELLTVGPLIAGGVLTWDGVVTPAASAATVTRVLGPRTGPGQP